MANIRIPCLVPKTNKAGVTSWYWQPSKTLAAAGWPPITLGKDEGAAIAAARTRNAQVERWKAGGEHALRPDGHPIAARAQQGTLGALVARYKREVMEGTDADGNPLLRNSTKRSYAVALKRIDHWGGKQPLAWITPARVADLRRVIARPRAANGKEGGGGLGRASAFNLLRTGRQLFSFAETVDLTPRGSNPFKDFDLAPPAARRTVWEAEDEAAFIAAAYDLGLPSMALAAELAEYTGQREGDLIAFTEPKLQRLNLFDPVLTARLGDGDGQVWGWCLAQGKTSDRDAEVRMEIPLEPEILVKVRAAIKANRARDRAAGRLITYVLVDDTRDGLPWSERQFIRAWKKVLAHAIKHTGRSEMAALNWHDWRRTRVVRLRRLGIAKEMIASITGHSLKAIEAMLRVYGPVDPTVTAAAIVASLPALPVQKPRSASADGKEQ